MSFNCHYTFLAYHYMHILGIPCQYWGIIVPITHLLDVTEEWLIELSR